MNHPVSEPEPEHIQATSVYAAQRTEELRRRREELRARREALERERDALAREEAALAARIQEEIRRTPEVDRASTRQQEVERLLEAYHHHNSEAQAHHEEMEKIRQLAAEHWYALGALWPWFAELKQAAEEANQHLEWLKDEIARLGLDLPEPATYIEPDVMTYLAPSPRLPRNASWLLVLSELGLRYGEE